MTPIRLLCLAAVIVGLARPARAADDEDEAYRRMIADQRKMMEKIVLQRPELRPGQTVRMDELIRIAVVDGKLALSTPLLTTADAGKFNRGQLRVKIEGLDGWAMVMCQNMGRGAASYFSLSHTSYADPAGQQSASITSQPGLVQIARNFNSATRNSNVNFQQIVSRPELGMADGVTLNAFDGDNRGRNTAPVNVRAKDFAELRRKYPREVDQYLRPLLKELRLEGLFTVEHALAWQVFAAEWRHDDVLERQVRNLVRGLDAETYPERESAMKSLRALGPDAALILYHTDRDGMSLEQSGRVDALIAAHSFCSREQAARSGTDPDFLLDCLYSDEQAIRDVATARLVKLAGHPVDLDPAAPKEKRTPQIEALRRAFAPAPKTASTKPTTAPAPTPAKL